MTYVPEVKHKILYTFSRYSVSCDSSDDTITDVYEKASAFAFTSSHSLQAWDESKLPLGVINLCLSFSPLFRMTFLHPNRVFPRILRNTTNIEMACTLLMVLFFTKITL